MHERGREREQSGREMNAGATSEREGKGHRAVGEKPGSEVMQKGEIRELGSGGALDRDCGYLTAAWGAGLRW